MSGPKRLEGPSLSPASGGSPQQVVILLHGFGASGSDLVPLAAAWRDRLPNAMFILPDAPEPLPGYPMGRQWFPLTDLSLAEITSGLAVVAPTVRSFVDRTLTDLALAPADIALVGFSQGAMIALEVGLSHASRIAAIVAYSGLLARAPRNRAGAYPPVLLGHGAKDTLVPPAALGHAESALAAAGVSVETMLEAELGHGISEAEIERGGRFLAEAFVASAKR